MLICIDREGDSSSCQTHHKAGDGTEADSGTGTGTGTGLGVGDKQQQGHDNDNISHTFTNIHTTTTAVTTVVASAPSAPYEEEDFVLESFRPSDVHDDDDVNDEDEMIMSTSVSEKKVEESEVVGQQR